MPARHGRRKRSTLIIQREGFFKPAPPPAVAPRKNKKQYSDAVHRKSRW